jgi:hypothetical protein
MLLINLLNTKQHAAGGGDEQSKDDGNGHTSMQKKTAQYGEEQHNGLITTLYPSLRSHSLPLQAEIPDQVRYDGEETFLLCTGRQHIYTFEKEIQGQARG